MFGLGFPPFTGGPFRYIDITGAQKIVEKMKRLEDTVGPLYRPADLLVETASMGRLFRSDLKGK